MLRKLIALIIMITMLCTCVVYANGTNNIDSAVYNIHIIVDGEELIPKDVNGKIVNPFLLSGTTYLPVRAVSQALGQKVTWEDFTNTVFIGEVPQKTFEYSDVIKIVVNGTEILPKDVNGNVVVPFLIDGTTYIPIRAVTQALGKEISWDGDTYTVYIGEATIKRDAFEINSETLRLFADKTLMSVNSQPISGSLFNFFLALSATDELMREYSENYTPAGTLQTLTIESQSAAEFFTGISEKNLKEVFALCQAAEKEGLTNNNEFMAVVNDSLNGFQIDENIEEILNKISLSKEDLMTFMKTYIISYAYADKIYQDKKSENYDTTELEEIYRKNYITAKHILVEDEALAKQIVSKIEKGENFDALMNEHNIDPGATEKGYTFTYGEMVEPFEKAAFALPVNTFTKEPVKTDFGYHIIMRIPVSEEVLAEIKTTWIEQMAQSDSKSAITQIVNSAKVEYTPDYENYIKTIK